MALNIKDPETEQLAAEVAALAGESKTGALRQALRERKQRLSAAALRPSRPAYRLLEKEIWPSLPTGAPTPTRCGAQLTMSWRSA